MPFADRVGRVARGPQYFGDRDGVAVQIAAIPVVATVVHHMSDARLMRVKPRQQRRPRRTATRRVIELSKAHAVSGKRVQIRRIDLAAVTTYVRKTHVVGHNDDDVWARLRRRSRATGLAALRDGERQQQVGQCSPDDHALHFYEASCSKCGPRKMAPPRRRARVLAGWDFAFHALRKKLRPRVGAPASSRAGISHSMPCEKSCAPASVRPRPRGLGFRIPCLAKKVAPPRRCARVLAGWDFAFHALRKKSCARVFAGWDFAFHAFRKTRFISSPQSASCQTLPARTRAHHLFPSISFLPNPAREDAGAPLVSARAISLLVLFSC